VVQIGRARGCERINSAEMAHTRKVFDTRARPAVGISAIAGEGWLEARDSRSTSNQLRGQPQGLGEIRELPGTAHIKAMARRLDRWDWDRLFAALDGCSQRRDCPCGLRSGSMLFFSSITSSLTRSSLEWSALRPDRQRRLGDRPVRSPELKQLVPPDPEQSSPSQD